MLIKQRPLPEFLPQLTGISPLLTRIYAARGITEEQQLNKNLTALQPFSLLKGIDKAVELLISAIEQQRSILVVGDFDADGATATALAVQGLTMLGIKQVDYLVPNRFEYGYGLTPELVSFAIDNFNPWLIITVDNGIASVEGVASAKAADVKVLITDHHLPSNDMPAADAIVNPNQPDCLFASKTLAGVGVMFYVLIALRARLRANNYFAAHHKQEPNLAELLDLVALGTVADLVPLDANNRIFVEQGVKRIQKGKTRPAIKALLTLANKNISQITAMDLGFIIAPRLNAAGRLDDMKLGIECLLCTDETIAYQLVTQLESLNSERKMIEQSMQTEAFDTLKNINLEQLPIAICLYNQDWHQGVIGILAARLKEKYHRPTIVFAKSDKTGLLKGSARSIDGLHIRDVLQNIASKYPNLIDKFGGHAMAAGLTLQEDKLTSFISRFEQEVKIQLTEEDLQKTIFTDGSLQHEELTLQQAQLLSSAGPWGQSFPEPIFNGIFQIEQQRLLKDKHLKLWLSDGYKHSIEAIAFNIDREIWPNSSIKEVHIVYRLTVNEYMGKQNMQLVVSYLQPI